jgi:hypothetical protein
MNDNYIDGSATNRHMNWKRMLGKGTRLEAIVVIKSTYTKIRWEMPK